MPSEGERSEKTATGDKETEELTDCWPAAEELGKRECSSDVERAKARAQEKAGVFLRRLDHSSVYLFACELGHTFMLGEDPLAAGEWCPRCPATAGLGCSKGRGCPAGQARPNRAHCRECSRRHRQLLRELLEQENAKIDRERKELQNSLLAEARQQMLGQRAPPRKPQGTEELPQRLRLLLAEVNQLATRKAQRYLSQLEASPPPGPAVPLDMLEELFRVLITPSATLLLHLRSLGKPQLRRFFRQSAVLIHPDKNPHPAAKAAFQKLLDQYERVLRAA